MTQNFLDRIYRILKMPISDPENPAFQIRLK